MVDFCERRIHLKMWLPSRKNQLDWRPQSSFLLFWQHFQSVMKWSFMSGKGELETGFVTSTGNDKLDSSWRADDEIHFQNTGARSELGWGSEPPNPLRVRSEVLTRISFFCWVNDQSSFLSTVDSVPVHCSEAELERLDTKNIVWHQIWVFFFIQMISFNQKTESKAE